VSLSGISARSDDKGGLAVGSEDRVVGEQAHRLSLSLGDQQAIERITVNLWQFHDASCVLTRDRKGKKSSGLERREHFARIGGQLPKCSLDLDLQIDAALM